MSAIFDHERLEVYQLDGLPRFPVEERDERNKHYVSRGVDTPPTNAVLLRLSLWAGRPRPASCNVYSLHIFDQESWRDI